VIYDEAFKGLAYVFDAAGCSRGRFKLQYLLYEGEFIKLDIFFKWYEKQDPIIKENIEQYKAMHFVLKGFYEEFLYEE